MLLLALALALAIERVCWIQTAWLIIVDHALDVRPDVCILIWGKYSNVVLVGYTEDTERA